MELRTLCLTTVCVLFLGCGLEGPVPSDKQSADPSQGPGMRSGSAVDNPQSAHRTNMEPLGAKDAPYIQGRFVIIGTLPDKRVSAHLVGKGADGKRYVTDAGADLSQAHSRSGTNISALEAPSPGPTPASEREGHATGFSDGPEGPGYRLVNVPPGDYLLYLESGYAMLAWKRVAVKPGDQLTIDLTFDEAKAGSIVVTWPDYQTFGTTSIALLVTPTELDGADLLPPNSQPLIYVGSKSLALKGLPAGKYHVRSWARSADVEVTPGKEAQAILVKTEGGLGF